MSRIRWYPNERVQLADFELATGKLVMQDMARSVRSLVLPRGRSTTGAAASEARVLSGFAATVVGGLGVGSSLLIAAGSAVLGYVEDGAYHFGVVHGDLLPADATIDFSGASLDDYNVFARFIQSDAEQANRVFWNAAGLPPAEEIDTVNTQKVGTWEITSQVSTLAPPGNGEWFRICRVTVAAGPVISVLNDLRHFFFEGSAATSDGPYEQEWGDGTNDRNADRAAYGIGDLHMWAQLVRRQLTDIIGTAHFTLAPTSLVEMVVGHYGTSAGVDAGKHTDIVFGGGTARWWGLETFAGGGAGGDDNLAIKALSSPNTAQVDVVFNDAGDDTRVYISPRGFATALADLDGISIWFGSTATTGKMVVARFAADNYYFTFGTSDPSAVQFRVGSAEPERGIHLQFFGNYYTDWKALRILVPWNSMVQEAQIATSEWGLSGPVAANVATANLMLRQYTGKADDQVFLELMDFPDNATLSYIRICWKQDAITGTRARMYAARHQMAAEGTGDVPGDVPVTRLVLKAGAGGGGPSYVEYGATTPVSHITQFTCDGNNTLLRRQRDKIAIGIVSGSLPADRVSVFWIQLGLIYNTANPWPVLAV